jgi:hypothetical protein
MQDKQYQDFDRQIRSMLADAEAKPSRRVWKAVSARLHTPAAPAVSPWGWMRWAGLSLAAATAVAAGVFFIHPRTSIPTIIHNPEQAQLAQAADPANASENFDMQAEVAAPEAPVPTESSRPVVRRQAPQAAAPVQAAREDDGRQPEPEATVDVSEDKQQTSTASTVGRRPATRPVRPVYDPFLSLGPEPIRPRAAKPRPSIYAQGAVGSNDAAFRAPHGAAMMAPGEQYGFTELGASTYSVPFTAGIGVRFYATPRLSFGTGLDYTRLSRSFAGSYADVPGSVHHTLQYIGIPLRAYYDIVSSGRIKFYVYGGGEAEYCLSNTYKLFGSPDIVRSYRVDELQFSVGAGLGVEFLLSNHLGLYLDPGVNYYFPCNQPRSIRTEKPFMLNFDVGLRFNF